MALGKMQRHEFVLRYRDLWKPFVAKRQLPRPLARSIGLFERMALFFDLRQISIDLSASDAELAGQVIDGRGSTGQSPHHAGQAVSLAVAFRPSASLVICGRHGLADSRSRTTALG